jgi:hypothetical protein
MQATIWGMEHFADVPPLYPVHRSPPEKLGHVQAKTLNQLQEAMQKFHFQIMYKKGSEMPIDYLSCNINFMA